MNNYPYFANYMFQPNQQMPQPTDERIWVQGENGANAYIVAPNSFVRLWDSTANIFYEKQTDSSGRPTMEAFEYKKHDSRKPTYADDLQELRKRIENLEKMSKGEIINGKSNADDTTA